MKQLIKPVTRLEVEREALKVMTDKILDFVNDSDIVESELDEFIHDFDVLKLAYLGAKARVIDIENIRKGEER